MQSRFHLIKHGLATHKLSLMRDIKTRPSRFRRLVRQTSLILCSEMTRDLDLRAQEITTPGGHSTQGMIRDQGGLVIMPILRAGLVLAESFAELLPMARTAHVGIFRDANNERQCYMLSLPKPKDQSKFLVVDLTLSHGRSMAMAVSYLTKAGVPPEFIRCGVILASRQGAESFHKAHPKVELFAVGVDEELDANGHLIPGLGNPSSRMFRTNDDNLNTEDTFE